MHDYCHCCLKDYYFDSDANVNTFSIMLKKIHYYAYALVIETDFFPCSQLVTFFK